MSKPQPIQAVVTTVCLNIFAHTKCCYFSEIRAKVERVAGCVGEGFLTDCLERQGYTVDKKSRPWMVHV